MHLGIRLRLRRDHLELGVKLRDAVLHEEAEQVETDDEALAGGRGKDLRAILVVRAELVVVTLGGGVVALGDAEKHRVLHELAREGQLLLRARGLLEHGRERGERRDCHLRRNSRGVWGEDTTGGQFGVDGSSARGGQIWAPRGVLGRGRIRARSGASARASGSAETYLESTDQGRRLGGVAGVVRLPERLQGLGRGREVRHLPFSVQTITSVDAGRSLARSALRACVGRDAPRPRSPGVGSRRTCSGKRTSRSL